MCRSLAIGTCVGEFTPECGEIFQRRGRDCGRMCPKRDNGYGIEKADQKHMFETGYRSPSVERRTEGTGLGLSFVKMVMSAHGGRIVYRTREGGGSRFVLIMKSKQR